MGGQSGNDVLSIILKGQRNSYRPDQSLHARLFIVAKVKAKKAEKLLLVCIGYAVRGAKTPKEIRNDDVNLGVNGKEKEVEADE